MKLWMTMGLALVSTLLIAGCTMPPAGSATQGQGTPAPQPDYGSKAYGY